MKHYTLPEKLIEVAKRFPNKTALQIKQTEGDYKKYSYQEFYKNSVSIAQSLVDLGIKKDDRVAIVLENRPEWAMIYFGIMLANAIAVSLDSQSTKDDLEYFFKDSESKVIFTSTKIEKVVCEAAQSAQNIVVLDEENINGKILLFNDFLKEGKNSIELKTKPEDIASILYTSGTTGRPKGVMLTHENFYSNFRSVEHLDLFNQEHNILSVLPLHHSFPFMVTLLIPLFSHNKITYVTSLKKEEITQCMQETGVTILVGVPQFFYLFHQSIEAEIKKTPFFIRWSLNGAINLLYLFRKLTKINLNKTLLKKVHKAFGKKLKYFVSGGARLDKGAEIFLNKIGFTLIQGYGLTETSPIVTFNPAEKIKIGSVGKVIDDVEIKIDDSGEVLIYGPNVMKGYYKHERETEEVIKDGWFCSGDLGYTDKDGYLFLTGRKKELIILGSGKNISPEEVESYYIRSRYIKELCVLSIGAGETEKLVAVVVPDFECFKKTGEIDVDDVIKLELGHLSKEHPPYKRVMGFVTTKEELPKTRLQKLKRYEIRKKYLDELTGIKKQEHREGVSQEDVEMMAADEYKTISSIITATKELEEPVYPDDHLGMDFGFDSLGRIELIAAIEKDFNVNIPENLAAEISTVKDLVDIVNKHVAERKPGDCSKKTYTEESFWKDVLKQDPEKEVIDKIDISPSWFAKTGNLGFYNLLFFIFKIAWRLEVSGVENIPKNGPFILCPNHASYLDAFLIGASLPGWLKRSIFFLGFHIYFDVPVIRSFIKIGKVVPIDPATNLIDAMRACAYVLKHKKVICIFPEGARSPDGGIKTFKKGVGILAQELKVPLVPVYIDGSFDALSSGRAMPKFNKIKVTFGKPIEATESESLSYDAIAKRAQEGVEKIEYGLQCSFDRQ